MGVISDKPVMESKYLRIASVYREPRQRWERGSVVRKEWTPEGEPRAIALGETGAARYKRHAYAWYAVSALQRRRMWVAPQERSMIPVPEDPKFGSLGAVFVFLEGIGYAGNYLQRAMARLNKALQAILN